MSNFSNFKLCLAASIALMSVSSNAYADRKPKPPFPKEMGSKTAVKSTSDAEAQKAEAALKKAAKSLNGTKEFQKAVQARDTRAISLLLTRQSGLDVPLSVKFKDEVNIQSLTIFIGCQNANGVVSCGIWIY